MKIILTESDVKEILSVHVHEAYGIDAADVQFPRYTLTNDFCVISESTGGEDGPTE